VQATGGIPSMQHFEHISGLNYNRPLVLIQATVPLS